MAATIASKHTNGSTNGHCQQYEEVEIPVPWGKIAGKWWGNRDVQPVLALHGWQDNCGTFDRLIPLLPENMSILALDLPGHGLSTHYPQGMNYYVFWDGVSLIRRIVKHYGWTKISLLGHSLGGALSFMYAASFPDEVDKFISIDINGPTVRDLHKNAKLTGSCIDKSLQYEKLPMSKMPCYSYEEMIQLVVDAYAGSIDRPSAEILMKRGMNPAPAEIDPNGYHFARDVRLKISMWGMLSLEQVLCYAEQIKCRVLNIRAIPGLKWERPEAYGIVLDSLRRNSRLSYHEIDGTHHIHLTTPERISEIVGSFLLNYDDDEDSLGAV